MDTSTTLAGLVIILIILIPIVLAKRKIKKREKMFLQSLYSLAEENRSEIIVQDHWNDTAIGIDTDAHKLFFIRQRADNKLQRTINLAEIQKCRILQTSRILNSKNGSQTVIDRLGLAFISRDQNSPEQILEFFNSDYESSMLYGETQLCEKWLQIVNDTLMKILKIADKR